jgi:putative sporulation and cell division repeat protein
VKKKPAAKKKKPQQQETPSRLLPPTKILQVKTQPQHANVRLTPALPWTKTTTTASKAC